MDVVYHKLGIIARKGTILRANRNNAIELAEACFEPRCLYIINLNPVVAISRYRVSLCLEERAMKEKDITVLMVEPNKHPTITTLTNDLDALQKAVSIGADYQGLIEIIGIEDGVCVLCNEEGKLIRLEGNRKIGRDIITGVFYVVGEDGHGNLTSLPKDKIESYQKRFWEPEQYTEADIDHALFMRLF